MERDELVAALTLNGYENVPQVMEKGEFSVRGDIVDIYSPSYTEPVRVSFFDTEIDQIKTFDRETQRSTGQLEETAAVPASAYAFPEDKRDEIADLILGSCAGRPRQDEHGDEGSKARGRAFVQNGNGRR